jgi:hypothetical protein
MTGGVKALYQLIVLVARLPDLALGDCRSRIGASLNLVDSRRARILVDNAVGDIARSMDTTKQVVDRHIRKAKALGLDGAKIQTLIAGGTLEGAPKASLVQITAEMKRVAKEDGKVWVVDRNGELMRFGPERYAVMVYNTTRAQATNIGTLERLAEKRMFYVKIIGSDSENFCTAFNEKVYYTGPGEDPKFGYPHIRVLPRGGPPFHPNCTKTYVAFVPGLASPDEIAKSKPDEKSRRLHGQPPGDAQRTFEAGRKPVQSERPGPSRTGEKPRIESPNQPVGAGRGSSSRSGSTQESAARASRSPAFSPTLQQHADQIAAEVTAFQRVAVERYQSVGPRRSEGYADVNNYHRFGKTPVRPQAWVDSVTQGLDELLTISRLPEAVTTYRAIRDDGRLLDSFAQAEASGLPWPELGFYSSSASPDVAKDFWGNAKVRIVVEMVVPSGTPAVFPASITGKMGEQNELILARGTEIKILSITNRDGVVIVKASHIR